MSDRNWKEYNEALVRRGEVLLDMDFIEKWPDELARMNEGKEGKPFLYPESLIKLLAIVHVYLLPYRQLEGFTRALMKYVDDGLKAPDFTSIAWRVARMDVSTDAAGVVDVKSSNEPIVIALDSSGIKVANRGRRVDKEEEEEEEVACEKGVHKDAHRCRCKHEGNSVHRSYEGACA